jgi:hypothetical protein
VAHPDAGTWHKLGVTGGQRLGLLGAPKGWDTAAVPPSVTVARRRVATPSDVLVAFFTRRRDLVRDAADLVARITDDGAVWVAWPRKAAGHESDLGDEAVRSVMLGLGVVDVKVAMLD